MHKTTCVVAGAVQKKEFMGLSSERIAGALFMKGVNHAY